MGIAINHVQLPDFQKNRLVQGNVGISGGFGYAAESGNGGGRVLPPATSTFT
ncbi:MAG: hypothetical protein KAH24_05500 [Holophagae bacterium]|nr:hypothetical protein [Holophagae bacterium]